MLFRTRTLALTGLLLAVFAAAPVPAEAPDGSTTVEQDGRRRRRRVRRRPPVPQQVRELVRSLDVTPEQRELARAEARRLAPIAQDARQRARELVRRVRADETSHAAAREELHALRAETRAALLPHGRRIVDSLTPEQLQRLERAAAARGRTFDPDRLAARVARVLARPRVQERLERGPAR
jgi:hypothetical protein